MSQTLYIPHDVVVYILDFLVEGLFGAFSQPGEELPAISTEDRTYLLISSQTCHAFADAVRPYIFQSISIKNRTHAENLYDIYLHNQALTSWVQALTIQAFQSDQDTKDLLIWLSSPNGVDLLSRLGRVTRLKVVGLSSEYRTEMPSFHPKAPLALIERYKKAQESEVTYQPQLRRAWRSLRQLQGITSLELWRCLLPAREDIFEWLTILWPHLNSISLVGCEADTDTVSESSASSEVTKSTAAIPEQVTKLLFCGSIRYFFGGVVAGLRCESLAELIMTGAGCTSYQDMISRAINLRKLVLLNCVYLESSQPALDLGMNRRLTHLMFRFEGFYGRGRDSWPAEVIATLPHDPGMSSLECLEVVFDGLDDEEQDYNCARGRDVWKNLDDILSEPRFERLLGTRTLRIRNVTPATVHGAQQCNVSEYFDNVKFDECFARTVQRG